MRLGPSEAVQKKLTDQAGLITRIQLERLGMSECVLRRLLRSGEWSALGAGLYRRCGGELGPVSLPTGSSLASRSSLPTGSPLSPLSAAQRLWGGVLLGGPESALGGAAALALTRQVRPVPEIVTVWMPSEVRRASRPPWRFVRDFEGRLDHRRGSLPHIAAEDAVLDLSARGGIEGFVGLVTDAVRSGALSLDSVRAAIVRRLRVTDRRLKLAMLDDLAGIESGLEHAYRCQVERAHGLPQARRQVSLVAGFRADCWYDEFATLVELDGRHGHIDGEFRDMRRDNAHALRAQVTLRYGSDDVRRTPCLVADQVAQVLQLRGWGGNLRRCRHCGGG